MSVSMDCVILYACVNLIVVMQELMRVGVSVRLYFRSFVVPVRLSLQQAIHMCALMYIQTNIYCNLKFFEYIL